MNKLRKLIQEEINKIIENHQHWLRKDCEGWEDMRADLSYADIRYADFENSNLRYANLENANLRYVDLENADLRKTNLYSADLENADLRYADLGNANLRYANLSGANLSDVNLRCANLSYADLSNANLRYADLSNANLKYADLSNADLENANLKNTKINYPLACPVEGSFIAWKKAENKIVKLQILEDSKRLSATTNKCRCDKALVLEIQDLEGNRLDDESVRSNYDGDFIYKVGEIASVDNFNENRWNECSPGIHFFFDRQMAVDY